jgi:hypothetical protein
MVSPRFSRVRMWNKRESFGHIGAVPIAVLQSTSIFVRTADRRCSGGRSANPMRSGWLSVPSPILRFHRHPNQFMTSAVMLGCHLCLHTNNLPGGDDAKKSRNTRWSQYQPLRKRKLPLIQFGILSAREDSMQIRPMRGSDLERATGLLRQLGYHMSLDVVASRITNVIASDAHHAAVAVAGEKLLGLIQVFERPALENPARRWYSRSSSTNAPAGRE